MGYRENHHENLDDYNLKIKAVLAMMEMVKEDETVDGVVIREGAHLEEGPSKVREALDELDNIQEEVIERLEQRFIWLEDFLAEEEILREELMLTSQATMDEAKNLQETLRANDQCHEEGNPGGKEN